jgi:lysophospholipase L1-like esterase
MNSNRRVLLFVIFSVGLLLAASYGAYYFKLDWMPFKRVNLVSEVVHEKVNPKPPVSVSMPIPDTLYQKDSLAQSDTIAAPVSRQDINLYLLPGIVTDFNTDTLQPALDSFSQRLYGLSTGLKRKIRIAYFGDSMIEGDLISQTLRKELQAKFGGSGVGFVPITSPVAKFRISATSDFSDTWTEDNFRQGKGSRLFLSGHLFRANNGWVQIRDQSIENDTIRIEKSLLCGAVPKTVAINFNNKKINLKADQLFNRIPLADDKSRSVRLAVNNENLPLYGVSFESATGVFVDNFPFRGVSGLELARIDSSFLSSIAANNPYDLIIIQYGVNLLFRPNERSFHWYGKMMKPIIRRLQNCFPGTDIIIVSTADRAFRYSGEYKSAVGMDSLIYTQAELAYQTGTRFYNQFATMGGAGSIVRWVKMKPSWANKDYIHPNFRGAEVLGHALFEAILTDYEKYVHQITNANTDARF